MLASVLDSLRAWPAVHRGALSSLLPPGQGQVAWVLDLKVARALRALGYTVLRGPLRGGASPTVVAALKSRPRTAGADDIELVRGLLTELGAGGFVLLRSSLRERERMAAAFLHVGLHAVSQVVLRRSVLTVGQRLVGPDAQPASQASAGASDERWSGSR